MQQLIEILKGVSGVVWAGMAILFVGMVAESSKSRQAMNNLILACVLLSVILVAMFWGVSLSDALGHLLDGTK